MHFLIFYQKYFEIHFTSEERDFMIIVMFASGTQLPNSPNYQIHIWLQVEGINNNENKELWTL